MKVEKLVAEPFQLEGFTAEEVFGVVRDLFNDPDATWGQEVIYHVDGNILGEALADPEGYGLEERTEKAVEALRQEVEKAGGAIDLIFGG